MEKRNIVSLIFGIFSVLIILTGCIESGESFQEKYKNDEVELIESEEHLLTAVNSLLGEKYSITPEEAVNIVREPSQLLDLFITNDSTSSLNDVAEAVTDILGTLTFAAEDNFSQTAYKVEYKYSHDGDTQVFNIINGVDIIRDSNGNVKFQDVDISSLLGKELVVRDLLINTPEVAKNNQPAELFAAEAKSFSEKILSNAQNIVVSYDVGPRKDKYDRDLMYIWVDGELYQELILKTGFAKIAYVNEPNTSYLPQLRKAEAYAKKEKLGVWGNWRTE